MKKIKEIYPVSFEKFTENEQNEDQLIINL